MESAQISANIEQKKMFSMVIFNKISNPHSGVSLLRSVEVELRHS